MSHATSMSTHLHHHRVVLHGGFLHIRTYATSSSVSDLYFGRNLCDYNLYLCKEGLMILMRVQCPYGQSAQIIKGGKPETGQ